MSARDAASTLTGDVVPRPFHLLAKPTGAICNLDCEYCFFLSKEMLYPGSRFRMAEELHEAYVRQLLDAHRGQPEVVVAWQGGEPTMMGLDFFRHSVELQRQYAQPGQRILNTIQTNGTLLTDSWGEFFRENEFLVGISIDGPRELHDAYRVDKRKQPTFDRVLRGLDVLKRHDVEWNVLTTIHAMNAQHGRRVYTFLRDELGATFIQFIPIIERTTPELLTIADKGWGDDVRGRPLYTQVGTEVTHRSVGPEQYGRFLIDVFEEWVRHDIASVYVQMFDTTLANYYGEQGSMCVHSETCGQQLALEHNGDVYSCDHFVEPKYLLGNIGTTQLVELVASPRQRAFGLDKRDSLPKYCRECEVRFACHGGCPKDRFAVTPDGERGLHYLCASYKSFFSHVDEPMRAMCELLAINRAPSELMVRYAASDSKRGEDEPCPCWGGLSWKNCHGALPVNVPIA